MKISWRLLLAPLFLLTFASLAHAQTPEIIIYGQNTPQWNAKLGATATRGSCGLAPEACMTVVTTVLNRQNTRRFYLNIFDGPDIVERTAYYSQASRAEPRLYELDVDDFTDHFNGWCHKPGRACGALLGQLIANTKSQNPALKFGVTLYEDQLSQLLANPQLTPALRSQIDTVHLIIHQRQNGPGFDNYVNTVMQAFPNAQVIGGAYPYDRVDYVSCGAAHCNASQELGLYQQTLKIEMTLLRRGVLSGIEFYPGNFGMEDTMAIFNDPRGCSLARKRECIDNTRIMHQTTANVLNQFGIGGR